MADLTLITLTAKRITETDGHWKGFYRTEFYKPDGSLYCVFQAEAKQPRKNKKIIIINCNRYSVKWDA